MRSGIGLTAACRASSQHQNSKKRPRQATRRAKPITSDLSFYRRKKPATSRNTAKKYPQTGNEKARRSRPESRPHQARPCGVWRAIRDRATTHTTASREDYSSSLGMPISRRFVTCERICNFLVPSGKSRCPAV